MTLVTTSNAKLETHNEKKIRIVVKVKRIFAQFASTSAMATTNTTIFL
jgi:hypothetical protein